MKKLCEIFNIEYTGEEINIEDIQEENKRLLKLKQYTDDEEFISNIDSVAFNQEELAGLYDKGVAKIYLCGEKYVISLLQNDIHYIGVNQPLVVILNQK